MHKANHFTFDVAGAALLAAALAFAPAAFAAPSGYFDFTHSYTEDTGIVCGSGANSFDIIDSATVHKYGPRLQRRERQLRQGHPLHRHGRHVQQFRHRRVDSVQVARHRA